MSFADCIRRAIDAKETDAARGAAATELWQGIADGYERQGFTRHQAETMAGEDVKKVLRKRMERERHEVLAQIMTERRNKKLVDDAASDADAAELPFRILEASTSSKTRISTVVGQQAALMRQFNGMVGDFLKEHSRNIVGNVRNKARLKDIVRELHGESSGDPQAKAFADAIRDTIERTRLMFNAAGGDIGKLDGEGLPHRHDRNRILDGAKTRAEVDASFVKWAEEVAPRLDWTRIENFMTGRPFSIDGKAPAPEVQRGFLREIFDTIITDGANKRAITWGQRQGKRLSRRYSEARVLHFRSADDWMDYNDKFGAADIFGSVTGHLHRMARDISLMQNLGVSHTAGLENLIGYARKRVAGNPTALRKLESKAFFAKAMLDEISGTAQTPVSERWARFFSGTRQVLTSAQLGSAVLASGSDSVAIGLAARSVGMNPANAVSRHVSLMASSATRETAAQMGFVADTLADAGNTMARLLGEAPMSDVTERLSSFVMRAQGLSFWTDMGRTAFQMEMAGSLANAKSLADLPENVATALRQRGISDSDWAEFANESRHFVTETGERFASPVYWRHKALADGMDVETVERIVTAIDGFTQEMVEIAVPSTSVQMRAYMTIGSRPGTVLGELARSLVSYKSFTMTFTINQIRQIMAQPTGMGRAQYLFFMTAGFTMMGATGLQLKELAKGNEPRPMDTPEFWGAAGLQGGGFGVVGDLLSASTNRFGGGLSDWIAGPTVGFLGDTTKLTYGNAMEAIRGEDMNAGREATRFLKRYTPGTTLWQTRAAVDRLVWDQMQMFLDPEADKSMRRSVKNQMRDRGNGEWWPTGELSPLQ